MKNFIVILLLAACFLVSCSENRHDELPPGEKGSLSLTSELDADIRQVDTRANTPLTNFTGYKIVLSGAENKTVDCPADGKLANLTPGNYDVTLHNFTDDFVPAFNDPRYSGSKTAKVTAGANTTVALTLTQANAGVYFVYDASLAAAGLTDVVPTVTQGANKLV